MSVCPDKNKNYLVTLRYEVNNVSNHYEAERAARYESRESNLLSSEINFAGYYEPVEEEQENKKEEHDEEEDEDDINAVIEEAIRARKEDL